MGPDATHQPGAYVGQLADHARKLQHEARSAIAHGDYARAASLIGHAELLAEDVHGLVDDIEKQEAARLIALLASDGDPAPQAWPSWPRIALPPFGVRAALGASLAMTLALAEC